jgi:hypothetical protein
MSFARPNDGYDYTGNFKLSSLATITQAERRLAVKKQALDDMQNEYNLLEEQAFKTYKSNIYYLTLDQEGFINQCKTWLKMKKENKDADGNKLDGRKKYKEKNIYDYYIEHIEELLGIEGISDIKFIDYNFGQATEIEFSYLNHKWELEIPHIKSIQLKAYQNYGASVFKLKLTHQDVKYTSSWSCIGYTYEEDELKDLMQQGIEKYVTETVQ